MSFIFDVAIKPPFPLKNVVANHLELLLALSLPPVPQWFTIFVYKKIMPALRASCLYSSSFVNHSTGLTINLYLPPTGRAQSMVFTAWT